MVKTVFDISIDFAKSHGSYVFDKRSKKYFLDLFSMFSSLPLGYNHEIFDVEFDKTVQHLSHLRMCNNLFHSDELENFGRRLKDVAFHPNIHFSSTGALAVESGLKCGYEYTKNPELIVVGLQNSFHGINSWGLITDCSIEAVKNRTINYPRNDWRNLPINGVIDFIAENSKQISSVIVEPIQCTAGDIHLDIQKLKNIQDICKDNDICFITDEIQTGFGVTGEYWYSNGIGLEPDIIVFGKKSQICGIMVSDKYASAIKSKYRKLEVTFDGDLIDAVRAQYIIDAIDKFSLLQNVKKNSKVLASELSGLFENYRSAGYLIAFDFGSKNLRDNFVSNAYENHLLVNPTGEKSVRLRPNLAFTDNEIDDFLFKIRKIRV